MNRGLGNPLFATQDILKDSDFVKDDVMYIKARIYGLEDGEEPRKIKPIEW